jgi:hypothetical protein
MDSLTELLHEIQTLYFPRWDPAHKYHIEKWDLAGARCLYKEKLIQVSDPGDELVIIHEICHAVSPSGGHGERWQKRFLKVADMAHDSGNLKLAEAIRIEVKQYQKQLKECPEGRLNAEQIRSEIYDTVFDCPDASFEDVVKWTAREHSMLPDELLKYLPKSLSIAFKKAHGDLEAQKLARQKFGIP